jgi:hypothetical protein
MTRELTVALWGACLLLGCGGEELVSARGEIEFSPRELDFGAVWVGERVEGTLVIANNGRASTTVGLWSSRPPFEVQDSVEVPAVGETAVKVGFRPVAAGEATGEVRLLVEGAEKEFRTQVRGEGVAPRISHPGKVDFGAVRVGERVVLPIALGNETSRDMVDLRVAISGSDEAHFLLTGDLRELPAQTSGEVLVAFEPGLVRSYRALLSVAACEACPMAGIDLVGRGGESNVVASPGVLDFGPVVVGGSRERSLTIRNLGEAVARLREVRIEGTGFSAPRSLSVNLQGHESYQLPVRFSPWEAGDREATLTVLDETGAAVAEAGLRGRGAAVELAATPAAVDLDMVPLGSSATVRLTIAHAGEEPIPVQLIGATIEGGSGWTLTAPSFPLGVGSEAVEMTVDFAANTLGRSEATLVISTSVPFQPELYVPLVARVAKDEDCRLSFLPWLRFGLLPSGRTHVRALTVTNAGGRDCMIWGIELDPAGSARFSFPEPPGEAVLSSGERLEIPVAFAAEVPSLQVFSTTLRFRSSDFAAPEVEVPVSGYTPGLDVYAEPEPLDFGLVPVGRTRHAAVRLENRSLVMPEYSGMEVEPDRLWRWGDPRRLIHGVEWGFAASADHWIGNSIGGEGLRVDVYFRPSDEPGPVEAELWIWLRAEPEPVVVRLRGEGTDGPCGDDCDPPVAICPAPARVPTWQWAPLEGGGIDPQGDPVLCRWEHWRDTSEEHLLDGTFELGDSCRSAFQPREVGEHKLLLTVWDPQGNLGQCTTTLSAFDPLTTNTGLWVRYLSGDSPSTVVLLHPAGGSPMAAPAWAPPFVCDPDNPAPDWDQPGIISDDPLRGRCPNSEPGTCIRIERPTPLIDYHVGLTPGSWADPDSPPGTSTTEVHCGGQLVARESMVTSHQQRAWVGTVRFDDPGGCTWTRVGSVWTAP